MTKKGFRQPPKMTKKEEQGYRHDMDNKEYVHTLRLIATAKDALKKNNAQIEVLKQSKEIALQQVALNRELYEIIHADPLEYEQSERFAEYRKKWALLNLKNQDAEQAQVETNFNAATQRLYTQNNQIIEEDIPLHEDTLQKLRTRLGIPEDRKDPEVKPLDLALSPEEEQELNQ